MSCALWNFAGHAVARDDTQKRVGDEHILQGYLDMLAKAGQAPVKQRHESAERSVHRTQMIGDIARAHERRTARVAAEVHQSAHGEGDNAGRLEIPIGPGSAESADRSDYQRRVN